MNEDSLKEMFDSLPFNPRAEAKARARAAALRAFDEVNDAARTIRTTSQGLAEPQRPTPENTKQGSNRMYGALSKEPERITWQYVGLAAAAAALVFFTLPIFQHNDSVLQPVATVVKQDARPRASERKEEVPQLPVMAANAQTSAGASPAGGSERNTNIPPGPAAAQLRIAAADVKPKPKPEEIVVTAQKPDYVVHEFAIAVQAIQTDEEYRSGASSKSGRDRFESKTNNPIKRVSDEPVSTFSIDVDTASYSFVRSQLNQGLLPDRDAVRLEEMVNYFPYAYAPPKKAGRPFSTHVTVIDAPWKPGNKLLRIGIKGYESRGKQPKSNLVFLLDVSGSMDGPDRLPLVKQSMAMLLSRLQPEDTVAIVVYAGAAGTVLEPTMVREKEKILVALDELGAGGSTAGGEGIARAYQLAESSFIKEGVNRIILATDGDFNVGVSDPEELQRLVERQRKSGVFLSVLGFGQGNYYDELMQKLAQNGNGVAAYIDTASEAQKVLVEEATSTLFPIAKDVKIQVEFNPKTVSEYRLLGYETRMLAEEDFNNDAVDAGDIGAGHTVTAIYEITPVGSDSEALSPSRYSATPRSRGKDDEYGFLKLRYKLPTGFISKLIKEPIRRDAKVDSLALQETRFATAVAGFAQLLQGSKYLGDWNYENALELAMANRGDDPFGYRAELVELIRKAEAAEQE